MKMINKEVWKDVAGFEGLYKVSSFGRIKSLKRKVSYKRWHSDGVKIINEKLLMTKKSVCGYMECVLSKKTIKKYCLVHRLVADAFLIKKEGSEYVNHIDGVKTNNFYKNLEWCTAQENILHGRKIGLIVSKKGKDSPLSHKVASFSGSRLRKTYWSIGEASRLTGIHTSNILVSIKNNKYKAGGLTWKKM